MPKKSNDDERLTDKNLEHVINMLNPTDGTKPWTKKECCQYLGITYNTTRLGTLIDNYKEKKEYESKKRAEKRGKPLTDSELSYIVSAYLVERQSIDAISKALFRPSMAVRHALDALEVPIRNVGHSYFRPVYLPDACIRNSFKELELVYSARYDTVAKIVKEYKPGIYLLGIKKSEDSFFAYQPAEELGSLEHLRKYINV